ncbi:MAG TPA: fibronectin type III domain-containing protein, partial [Anaeromyxobacter sp.]
MAFRLHNRARMSRALLLVTILAAPGLASGQALPALPSAGQITFPTVALSATDGFINLDECQNHRSITLRWAISYVSGASASSFIPGGSYQLYAASGSKVATTGNCDTEPNATNGVIADPASDLIKTGLSDPSANLNFDTSTIASVAGFGSCSGGDTQFQLCVMARDSGGTVVGTARTTLIASFGAPATPTGVSATAGDGAANVSWSEPDSTPAGLSFEIDAQGIGTIDPTLHRSSRVTGTSDRITGLVNGETYQINVIAFSDADNPSTPSTDPAFVSPQPVNDFWETYKDDFGGRDSGG